MYNTVTHNTYISPVYVYNMAEIEYQPIKKIAVHEIIKESFDDFLNTKASPWSTSNASQMGRGNCLYSNCLSTNT